MAKTTGQLIYTLTVLKPVVLPLGEQIGGTIKQEFLKQRDGANPSYNYMQEAFEELSLRGIKVRQDEHK